jgi:hypothetical protein
MSYDRPLGPGGCYPPPPLPQWDQPATSNTTTFSLPAKTIRQGAKIFTDIKDANDFMEGRSVTEVVVQDYEMSLSEGLIITVYYELEDS